MVVVLGAEVALGDRGVAKITTAKLSSATTIVSFLTLFSFYCALAEALAVALARPPEISSISSAVSSCRNVEPVPNL